MKPKVLLVCTIIFWGLTGCNLSAAISPTPGINATQVIETVHARLTITQAALALITSATPVPTASGSPTLAAATPTIVFTQPASPIPPAATATVTIVCNRAAPGYPKLDATIDDDTRMEPGQAFTKIWRLTNSGSCTWSRDYAAQFFFGDAMDAPDSVPLLGNVLPNQTVEIAVDMTAPHAPGTYQGNWKLRNSAGVLFGIGPNGDSPFWVRIIVIAAATATPTSTAVPSSTAIPSSTATPSSTPTATNTPVPTVIPSATPTLTPTPEIYSSGTITIQPGDVIDLDAIVVNPGSDEDLSYLTDASNNHLLTPLAGVVFGVYGSEQPGLQACQAASMSTAALAVESLSPGTYLCYHTTQARYGWARLDSFNTTDFATSLTLQTWVGP